MGFIDNLFLKVVRFRAVSGLIGPSLQTKLRRTTSSVAGKRVSPTGHGTRLHPLGKIAPSDQSGNSVTIKWVDFCFCKPVDSQGDGHDMSAAPGNSFWMVPELLQCMGHSFPESIMRNERRPFTGCAKTTPTKASSKLSVF